MQKKSICKLLFFFINFFYLFICFKLNVFSFENFITQNTINSYNNDIKNFTFHDVIIWEKNFFKENFNFLSNNFFSSIYSTRFFNYHIINILNFFITEKNNYIFYFNFIIFLNIFFFSFICALIANKIIIKNNYTIPIFFIVLVSWSPPLYIYLRSVTLFPLFVFCSILPIFYLYFNFSIYKYLVSSSLIFFLVLFHNQATFFIYLSILSFPFIYFCHNNKIVLIGGGGGTRNILYNNKIIFYYIVSIIFTIILYVLVNFFIFNNLNINFVTERIFPKLIYYLTAFNKCDYFFLCYLNGLLGNIRYILDTYYTFIPFYNTGHNPWDLTIGKEIRIISPLVSIGLIFLFRNINKDFISRLLFKYCFLSLVYFLIYYMIFPFQIIAYEYTPYWLLYPYYLVFLVYLSYIVGTKFKKYQNTLFVFFILLFIFSIYRQLTLIDSKFLNIVF